MTVAEACGKAGEMPNGDGRGMLTILYQGKDNIAAAMGGTIPFGDFVEQIEVNGKGNMYMHPLLKAICALANHGAKTVIVDFTSSSMTETAAAGIGMGTGTNVSLLGITIGKTWTMAKTLLHVIALGFSNAIGSKASK